MSKIESWPRRVKQLCALGAWVVGGAATEEEPGDIDLMIPWKLWTRAAMIVPAYASPSSLGGWHWKENGVMIDVWPDELSRLIETVGFFHSAWHPLSGQRIVIVRDKTEPLQLEDKGG